MAEAVELPSPTKYFCHQCSREVSPLHPLVELTCPECSSGFIEEVSRDLYEGQQDYVYQIFEDDNDENDEPIPERHPFFGDVFVVENNEGEEVTHLRNFLSFNELRDFLPYESIQVSRDGIYGSSYSSDYLAEDNIDVLVTQFLDEVEITGPAPLPEAQIKSLPTKAISKEHVDKGVQCTVCMNDFALREKVKCLPCEHFYHEKCITPWLERHATCPNCREAIKIQANCRGRRSVSCPRTSTHSDEESQHNSDSPTSSSSSSSLSDSFSTSMNSFRFLH